ncbi:hypothetical protein [Rhodococcus jostii]|uniref:hypothetical protein n=1 Tax=Rhodococcus jostii TaxID=132919 RepID=UPI001F079C40|nr:hypothetical protein [Rhodococcus jostii]
MRQAFVAASIDAMEHDPGELICRQDALAAGFTDDEIRRLYTRGGWRRLGHGAYLGESEFEQATPEARHRLLIDATVPRMSSDAVLSHQSAAVMYGLPVWRTPLDRVQVTRNRRGGGRIKTRLTVHCSSLDGRVAEEDGYLVTTPSRMVVDLGRALPFEQAVVTGDAAVRAFGISPEDLACELASAQGRKGVGAARRVVQFLTGYSESVGESRSRVMFSTMGLPLPSQQGVVRGYDGRTLGRVDFYIESSAFLGEFDGRVKYERMLKPGQGPSDAVFAEKRREDAMRELGFQMVRWTWEELGDPLRLAARIRRVLTRGEASLPPMGRIEQSSLPVPRRLTLRTV